MILLRKQVSRNGAELRRKTMVSLVRLYVDKQKPWPHLHAMTKVFGMHEAALSRMLSLLRDRGDIVMQCYRGAPNVVGIPGVGMTPKTNVHKVPLASHRPRKKKRE